MINLINFNKVDPDTMTSFNIGFKTEDQGFLNMLKDKLAPDFDRGIEKIDLEDKSEKDNVLKGSEESRNLALDFDRGIDKDAIQPADKNDKIKRNESLAGKDQAGQVDEMDEIDEGWLKEVTEQIKLLLKQLKTTDPQLFKQMRKEYSSIKDAMLSAVKNKSLKDEMIIQKLVQLLRKLKKIVLSKKQKPASNNDLIKINIVKAEENKDGENVKLNKDNIGKEDELFKKDNDLPDLKKVKIRKGNKKNQPDQFMSKNNKGSSPVKSKSGNRILNNFQIRNIKNNDPVMEVKENQPMKKADIQQLIRKVTNRIRITLAGNKNEIVMNLKPEFLGKVQIKLQFNGKSLLAKFTVDNIYAEKVFKDSLAQLKVNFQNMGMDVQGFDVKLNENRDFNLKSYLNETQIRNNGDRILNTGEKDELIELLAENYDSLGWIAQKVNLVV